MSGREAFATMWAVLLTGAAIAQGGVAAPPEITDEQRAKIWTNEAELSWVATSGNAESSSLGARYLGLWVKERNRFEFRVGGIRAESNPSDNYAVGTPDDFEVVDPTDAELSAENYYLNGRYDRSISDRTFWFAGGGWIRNEFAGIENRYLVEAGIGNLWWKDGDDQWWKTSYSLTFTNEDLVAPPPDYDDSFWGVRLASDYQNRFGENTTYQNITVLDVNGEETDDWRGSMLNAVTVSINKILALKVAYLILYDNTPAFEELTLLDPDGEPTGDSVLAELDELDTVFTTSLVFKF